MDDEFVGKPIHHQWERVWPESMALNGHKQKKEPPAPVYMDLGGAQTFSVGESKPDLLI